MSERTVIGKWIEVLLGDKREKDPEIEKEGSPRRAQYHTKGITDQVLSQIGLQRGI